MAYSERLAERIRHELKHLPSQEKKMFGGLAFFINNKICVTAGPDRMMVRIDPDLHEREVSNHGCETVVMGGRKYRGYIYVLEEGFEDEDFFKHCINLALSYNRKLASREKIE